MESEGIIKRRLAALRQKREAKATEELRDLERRAALNGVDMAIQTAIDRPNDYALICRPMPLSFYYGEGSTEERDAAFMRRRANFYAMCARVFGFDGWRLEGYAQEIFLAAEVAAGRDGRDLSLMPIDQTQAVNINANAAPLEWLVSQNWLETKADPSGFAMMRFAVALRFRDEVLGSQSGGLKAQAYEGSGSGFGPRLVSDYALDCMSSISRLRNRMHPGLYRLLQMIVVDDIWIWEIDEQRAARRGRKVAVAKRSALWRELRRRAREARRNRIILKLHKAIDAAAVEYDYLSEVEYRKRWIRPQGPAASSPR